MPEDPRKSGPIIKQLFDDCCDLSPAEQQSYIQQAAVTEVIKARVLQLLKHSNSDLELTQAVVDSMQVSLDIKAITAGMKVGAYTLIKPIGEGGQGEVWLADRSGGDFNHQVAIKFLKPVHDQHELARFQSERELLAQLKHPNIAQLLDGGEIANQRPYMVLEFVEGLPLLDYAVKHQFNLQQYLICFLQICEAISYAHSLSVIHRDIKPSNILITYDGTVKLLDFGIAKFIDQDAVKTQTLPMMTLAYSSPEQVTGAPVSTATDIYTLGLLLYEMLTGKRAQAHGSDVPAELIHEITQSTPIPPSALIKTIDFDRKYNNKQIKGDLDNLILMAVRKEPDRRYATVQGMANDIKNYLDGKPLIAVGDSWLYRSKKFINRNPVGTVLSAAVLAFLIILPLLLFSHQQKLTVERDRALAAQQMAEKQSTIAKRTTDFLVNILESASPIASKGEAINLDDVLSSAEQQLSVGLDDQPAIKANLLGKLGSIQHQLGNSNKAVEYYKTALPLLKSVNDIEGTAHAYGQLAIMSYFASDETAAIEYQQQALEMMDAIKDPKARAWNQVRVATIDGFFNKDELVVERLENTLSLLQQQNIEDAELLGRIYNELSIATADKELALQYNTLAVNHAETLHGRMHPLFQNRQKNLAQRMKNLQRYDEAEDLLLENRQIARQLFTENHPNYSGVTAELGALYHDLGRFSEVEKIYQEAISISLKTSGKESINYVLQINNLAYLYEDMGQYQMAEPLYRESVALRQAHHASNPVRIASSRSNLARLLAKMGQHQESQIILEEIMPIINANKSSNLQNQITANANLIATDAKTNNCRLALQQIEQLIPEVNKISAKSWRRMFNELSLGEQAFKCRNQALAKTLLTAAAEKSEVIYADGSDGQKLIQAKTAGLIELIDD